jgi:DNA-directed RNA polymerase subunit N (RpoN/RPB10)
MNRKERNDLAALDTIGIDLFCQRCGVRIGRVVDGVYLVIENTRFWEACRFTCRCGRSIRFKPIEPKDLHSHTGATKKILDDLGKDRKVRGH